MLSTAPKTSFQNKSLHTYLFFFLAACFILPIVYCYITETYGFLDDYHLFYNAGEKDIMNIFRSMGRPIYGLMTKCLFTDFYIISDLKYARIVSLAGIILFCMLLYRAYISAGWRKYQAGCAALSTCLMPAFGVYAAWASCFAMIYAIILAFIAGELCSRWYDRLHEPGLLRKGILFFGTLLLLVLSLMIYQPGVTAFWLFFAIALLTAPVNGSAAIRKCMAGFVIFSFSVMVYYIQYKLAFWPFLSDYFERSGITHHPITKLIWFFQNPFRDTLSLFSVLESTPVVYAVMLMTVLIILTALGYNMWKKNWKSMHLFIFGALIPMSYLPNLLSYENIGSFRTQGILGSIVIFYLLLSIKKLFKRGFADFMFSGLVILFGLTAFQNVSYGIVKPQIKEIELIKHALKAPVFQNEKEIIFIRSRMSDSLSTRLPRREYGLPSTFASYVPYPFINFIARENQSVQYMPIEVRSYEQDEKHPVKEGLSIINAGEIIRQYKEKIIKEKFDSSNDVRLSIDKIKGFEALSPAHQLTVIPTPQGLVLNSKGRDPHILLPELDSGSKRSLIVKVNIISPGDTDLQLFYMTPSQRRYSEKQSVGKKITRGDNVLYIDLPKKKYSGRFRLDPGRLAGEYLLKSIEIRAVSNS